MRKQAKVPMRGKLKSFFYVQYVAVGIVVYVSGQIQLTTNRWL